ncbi:BnaCnng16710D [Brassica napus]|uniref:(rape) hypothetical protein n=1 Tax=Brassica napus TaxID=3708 RepID=A0A078IH16_BRANA|nr:unnamed protein product [Brassica napus]CDY48694.1 BnaCnng16710D [Brassica napus]
MPSSSGLDCRLLVFEDIIAPGCTEFCLDLLFFVPSMFQLILASIGSTTVLIGTPSSEEEFVLAIVCMASRKSSDDGVVWVKPVWVSLIVVIDPQVPVDGRLVFGVDSQAVKTVEVPARVLCLCAFDTLLGFDLYFGFEF